MKLEAIKHQGKAASRQVVGKSESADDIANDESGRTVQRYIRLTYLLPKLLKKVDQGKIAMMPAVELSYLPKKMQEELLDVCEMQDGTPSYSQAVELKKLAQSGKLKPENIVTIMSRLKANQQDKLTFRKDTFAAYFPKGYTAKQMEDSIISMLKERKRQLERRRDEAR